MIQIYFLVNEECRSPNIHQIRKRVTLGDGETVDRRNEGLSGVAKTDIVDPRNELDACPADSEVDQAIKISLTWDGTYELLDDSLFELLSIIKQEIAQDITTRDYDRVSPVEFIITD